MGNCIVSVCASLSGVPVLSSRVALHLWRPCAYVCFHCSPPLVGVNKRRVNAAYGIVLHCDVLLGVPRRLVTRGDACVVVLLVCMVVLRTVGGGCGHASGKRCRWYCIFLASSSWASLTSSHTRCNIYGCHSRMYGSFAPIRWLVCANVG